MEDIENNSDNKIIKSLFGDDNRVITKPVVHVHTYYLSGTIGSSEEYIELFETIRNSSKNDIVRLHINSYGGDLFTAIQFMRVLGETEAQTIASVEGACMSAATMIFLACDGFEVSANSMFMFHNYSGGVVGKGGEMFDQLVHERKWSEKLLKDVYTDFLTTKEFEQIMENKDIWMDGDEVVKRLKKYAKKPEKSTKKALDNEE